MAPYIQESGNFSYQSTIYGVIFSTNFVDIFYT